MIVGMIPMLIVEMQLWRRIGVGRAGRNALFNPVPRVYRHSLTSD
jgi:hypothetical protein